MSDTDELPKTKRWYKASDLPPEVFEVWRKPGGALNPVAIVATVDADGTPRTAPYGSLRAVTMISPPNIAVSVCGHARVLRECMLADESRAIVEIDIQEVKNNMVSTLVIKSGVMISALQEFRDWFQTAIGELVEIS